MQNLKRYAWKLNFDATIFSLGKNVSERRRKNKTEKNETNKQVNGEKVHHFHYA